MFNNNEKIEWIGPPIQLTEFQAMIVRIERMTDKELKNIWKNIGDYRPGMEYAPGIHMILWKNAISIEMDKRGDLRSTLLPLERRE